MIDGPDFIKSLEERKKKLLHAIITTSNYADGGQINGTHADHAQKACWLDRNYLRYDPQDFTFYNNVSRYMMHSSNLPPRGLNGPADIPTAWKSALKGIRSVLPTAVLAGGALRDRDNGVKVKDLDIFVEAAEDNMAAVERALELLKKNGWDVTKVDAQDYGEWFRSSSRVIGVLETEANGCPPIQIIIGRFSTSELLREFDYGLCQIMFDGTVIQKTRDYDRDFSRKQFRLVTECNDVQFSRRVERYARLKAKYPDHSWHPGVMGESLTLGTLNGQHIITMYGV